MNEQSMEVQSGTPDAPAEPPKKAPKLPKPKKRRRWVRRLAVLAVLALIGAGAYRILSAPKVLQPSAGYQVEQAARQEAAYKAANLCRHCGGTFKKSLFSTKCSQCGKPKDY